MRQSVHKFGLGAGPAQGRHQRSFKERGHASTCLRTATGSLTSGSTALDAQFATVRPLTRPAATRPCPAGEPSSPLAGVAVGADVDGARAALADLLAQIIPASAAGAATRGIFYIIFLHYIIIF